MDFVQTTLDGENVKIINVTGSEKNTSIAYIDSLGNLKVKVKPVDWSLVQSLSTSAITQPQKTNPYWATGRQIGCVGLGDSMIAGLINGYASIYEEIIYQSNGRYLNLGNLGIGGQSISQIVERIPTAIALNPQIIFICMGTNDANAETLLTPETIALAKSGINQIIAAGITPIVLSLAPHQTISRMQQHSVYNGLLSYICMTTGAVFYDCWDAVRDNLTGGYISGCNYDITHPTFLGAKLAVSGSINKFFEGLTNWAPLNYDPTSAGVGLVPNSFFMYDSNSDGTPDGWTLAGASASCTIVDTNEVGRWAKMVKLSATGGANITSTQITSAGNLSIGDTFIGAARVKTSAMFGGRYSLQQAKFSSTNFTFIGPDNLSTISYSPYLNEFTVYKKFTVNSPIQYITWISGLTGGTGSGGGEVWVNRPQLINITKYGLT